MLTLIGFTGELISLFTALCWTITVISFEYAGKRVGSLSVNLIRLLFAFVILGTILLFTTGSFIPFDANVTAWKLLVMSGLIGFVIGDFFLFQALVDVGSRISLLIFSINPAISLILGLLFFNEVLPLVTLLGIFIVLVGILGVIYNKEVGKKENPEHRVRGLTFAFLGAVAQSVGLLFSKYGLEEGLNAFEVTQIRAIAAIFGFMLIIILNRKTKNLVIAFKNKLAMRALLVGSIFGPTLGVASSIYALNFTSLGVSTTIAQLNTIMIIPFAVVLFKEKVNIKEIFFTVVAFSGLAILILI